MPHRPSQNHQNSDNHRNKVQNSTKVNQHGIINIHRSILTDLNAGDCHLLVIPIESLTHITSYLPPPALLALGRSNKQLHDHVNDDNTWRRAYVCQFLGISPEDDLRNGGDIGHRNRVMMIRRTESTWRREFISRWNLRRRYERSRVAPVTHVPVYTAISDIYLMPSNTAAPTAPPGLLTASLQYGVVARSYPLTGKILRGYFDAAGMANGLGIGNPNAEFSPNVSKCTISADGGTAKILWGFQTGMVAMTVAAKALDAGRISGGKWVRCSSADQHVGSVEDAVWAGGSSYYCVTGGADGRVKFWDGKRMTCLWTSNRPQVHDPCVKVVIDIAHGVIASVMHSGQMFIWQGFGQTMGTDGSVDTQELSVREVQLAGSSPAVPLSGPVQDAPAREIASFYLHCPSDDIVSLLSVYNSDNHFYRVTLDVRSGDIARMAYGEGSTGTISALEPVFGPTDTSFIVIGDQLGWVTVFPWSDTCPTSLVPPLRKFEALKNGSISAIKWTPDVLVTGSSLGSAEVWDSLDFSHLRSFASVGYRSAERVWDPVSRIIVEKDLVIMSIGIKLMAWLGGPVTGSERKGKHLKMSSKSNHSVAKWQRQVELHKDIVDSRRELEDEQTYTRRSFGREREQLSQLDSLGLSEVEAVEYVLMLSRDEEERRLKQSPPRLDEDVFVGEFDDIPTAVSNDHSLSMAGSYGASASTHSSPKFNGVPKPYPLVAPSASNVKVQVSPRFQPEPMEAGMSISPINRENSLSGSLVSSAQSDVLVDATTQFPSMRSTPTRITGAVTPVRHSMSGSPESPRSVWSTPLRYSKSEGPSPSARSSGSSSYRRPDVPSSPSRQKSTPGGLSISRLTAENKAYGSSATSSATGSMTRAEAEEQEAQNLKYAIELSLAEARSRGENV